MNYKPEIHYRSSIRFKDYDHSQKGQPQGIAPTNEKQQYNNFQQCMEPTIQLNEFGQIAYNERLKLAERFQPFELDIFQIMPNHMHGIIIINHVGLGRACPCPIHQSTNNFGHCW
jgi:putative transposase